MTFCKYCSTVPIRLFSSRRDQQGYHDHHESLSAFQESADNGCELCKLFVHSLGAYKGKYASTRQGEVQDRFRLSSTKFGVQEVLFGYSTKGVFRGGWVPEEWRDERPTRAGQSEGYLLSYEARLLKRWASLCLDNHKACGHDTDYVPTRVIDVGTRERPSLRLITAGNIQREHRRYLALSHCWGLTMPASGRTTKDTLAKHFEGIDYNALPRTFQDFIDIARRLQVAYVWIDSLCIIQDSKDDWEKEAAQMAEVYSKSYLTIAASGSANGTEGCRVQHDMRSYGPVDVDCLNPDTDASSESKARPTTHRYRIWARDPDPLQQVLSDDPLTKRGWCLQERELAVRVVHYSKDTIRWECRELSATLEFPWGDRLPFDAGRLFEGGSFSRAPQLGAPSNDSKVLDTVTKQRLAWFELVHKYTARKLTKQTDILPALSGLARSVGEETSDRYVAGLWESYLPGCLLWGIDWHIDKGLPTHSRPADYLAPSWSWASVRGPVQYLSWINGYWSSFNATPDPKFLPKILSISLQPESHDPYARLLSGSLEIQGKVKLAYSKQEAYAAYSHYQDRLHLFSPSANNTPNKVGEIRYDIPLCLDCAPVGKMEIVFLLCCMNGERFKDGTFKTFAIALQPIDLDMSPQPALLDAARAAGQSIMTMRRVGVAWGIAPEFWDDAVANTLTLV